jgi:hypothetical protein
MLPGPIDREGHRGMREEVAVVALGRERERWSSTEQRVGQVSS